MRELDEEELQNISGGRIYSDGDEREKLSLETSLQAPAQFIQQFHLEQAQQERRERSRHQLDSAFLSGHRNRYRPATLSYKTPYLNK